MREEVGFCVVVVMRYDDSSMIVAVVMADFMLLLLGPRRDATISCEIVASVVGIVVVFEVFRMMARSNGAVIGCRTSGQEAEEVA